MHGVYPLKFITLSSANQSKISRNLRYQERRGLSLENKASNKNRYIFALSESKNGQLTKMSEALGGEEAHEKNDASRMNTKTPNS